MDTWGFIIIAVSGVVYFLARKKSPGLASFALYAAGIGTGIVIGAIWMVSIINRIMP